MFAYIWAGLMFATGMISNIGITAVADLAETNPDQAEALWSSIDAVTNGLGGGNELVGGMWILLVSLAAWATGALPKSLNVLGVISAASGLITVVPGLDGCRHGLRARTRSSGSPGSASSCSAPPTPAAFRPDQHRRERPMITVDGLTKTYGSRRAVDDLSFTVTGGRVTGFVGPNGSGKSTTMRMMVGLTRPDAGTVTYDGVPYRALPQPARTIGVALDAAAHPGRSARNHLRTLAAASAIADRPGRRRARRGRHHHRR